METPLQARGGYGHRGVVSGRTEQALVGCDSHVQIQVERRGDEDCVRISRFDRDGYRSEETHVGQYLLGATLGSAQISFNKLPLQLVQKELDRLRSVRKPYSLILSNVPGQLPPNMGSERNVSVSPRFPDLKENVLSNNPQERTPFRTCKTPDPRASSKFEIGEKKVTSFTPGPNNATQAYRGAPGIDDVTKIQASLERLRNQRLMMEKLKTENERKDIRVRSLSKQVESLRSDLASAQEEVETQSRVFAELAVHKATIQGLERELSEERERFSQNRESSTATLDQVKRVLDQEKRDRESERAELETKINALSVELEGERVRHQSAALDKNQLAVDLAHTRKELEETQTSMEMLKSKENARYAALERSMQSLQINLDDSTERLKIVSIENETRTVSLKRTNEALSSSEERANLLVGTIAELEENNILLRKQLLAAETSNTSSNSKFAEKLHTVENELSEKKTLIAQLTKSLTLLKDKYNTECADHKDTRSSLLRKTQEGTNSVDALKRVTAQYNQAKNKITELNSKVEQLHTQMLQERTRCSTLAQQLEAEKNACRSWANDRLELLTQFCEEEERFRKL
uniref:Uncharacterized protein n=1 Tax=Mucochytrium quahogii TaxID=96639 RepID=A0A7S2SML8_9STRA|mmetsp:Transcript_7343/g.15948  ORF Transcript_7343/g.15948 Transcript_7343/m.15948 type:complete len:579 (+) Transcript_7343:363-2099(+)